MTDVFEKHAFAILIALLPLAAYMTCFGAFRLMGRSFATTGGRDLAAIAMAVMGLVIVGPVELFFPRTAAALFGKSIWPILALLYFLVTTLIVLSMRRRLVVYGQGASSIGQPLLRASQSIDPQATWNEQAGQIELPQLNIHLRVDAFPVVEALEVFSYQPNLSSTFWNRLLVALRAELAKLPRNPPTQGLMCFVGGIGLLLLLIYLSYTRHQSIYEGFHQWFSR